MFPLKKIALIGAVAGTLVLAALNANSQSTPITKPLLTVKQIMNGILTPTTNTIWGAFELETAAEWAEVENAALSVIAAVDLLRDGGSAAGELALAANGDWQEFNNDMLAAARQVLVAVANKDEEALSSAGNDLLYPPCESCHQRYQQP